MEALTDEKTRESLGIQTNAEENQNNSKSGKLMDVKMVEGTPFSIVKNPEKEKENCFIAVAKDRLTDWMTEEEAQEQIEKRDWKLITQLAVNIAIKIKNDKTV